MPRRHNTPPHTPYKRPNTCGNKYRYLTELAARRAAQQGTSDPANSALYVYLCAVCAKWHLTRSKPAQNQ